LLYHLEDPAVQETITQVSQEEGHEAVRAKANVDSATALLEQVKRNLERTKVRAPFDGRVRQRTVGLGQSVGTGTALGTVFAIDFAEVRLPIAARDMAFLTLPEGPEDPPIDVKLRDALNHDETAWTAKIIRTEGALDENSLDLFAIARGRNGSGRKAISTHRSHLGDHFCGFAPIASGSIPPGSIPYPHGGFPGCWNSLFDRDHALSHPLCPASVRGPRQGFCPDPKLVLSTVWCFKR